VDKAALDASQSGWFYGANTLVFADLPGATARFYSIVVQ